MGWVKQFENENLEFWTCDTCNNPDHNYVVLKRGILDDRRPKEETVIQSWERMTEKDRVKKEIENSRGKNK